MRRARPKIAPNLVSAARLSKVAIAAKVEADKSNEDVVAPASNINTNLTQESSILPSLEPNDEATRSEDSTLIITFPQPEPVILLPPEVLEVTPSSVDKENVLTVVSDELSRDSQASCSVEPGVPSFSRYKSKNKVRPTISNAPHRIRTFSSASESEDDAVKRQSRRPLSPVKKSPAKKDNVNTTSPLPPNSSTEKGKRGKKKSDEKTPLEIKKAIMKRKFASGDVDRSKLTMFDLIYYNPDDGERPPNSSEKLQKRLRPFEVEEIAKESQVANVESTGNAILDDKLAEEDEMRMIEENAEKEGEKQSEEEDAEEEEEEATMPVPQVRLGPDGEIILDEKSLVIDTSETKRNKSQLANAPIIVENNSTLVNYGTWRKRRRAGRWGIKETARFYRALNMLGTNFSLMEKLFPGRDRVDLKRKFKSEEKNNSTLVDKTISKQIPFDITQFMDEASEEDSSGESKDKSRKDASKSTKTTGKESKGKAKGNNKKENALKKTVSVQEPIPNESDSDEVSITSIRSTYKKTSNEESEEEMAPPAKKSRKGKATESRVSTRGRKTATGSRSGKITRKKKVQPIDSDNEQAESQEKDTVEQENSSKNANPAAPISNNPLNCKKTVSIQEPNPNESDSDVVSIESIRSEKKTTNDESEEEMAPPAKKGRKGKATESRVSKRGRKTAIGSRSGKITRRKNVKPLDSDEDQPANPTENDALKPANCSKDANPAAPNSNNPLENLLNSPLGKIGLEQGGLTVIEDPGTPNQAPSFLVPPALSEANPAFARAEPGSLVLVAEPNPGDPNNQLVHVYRIAEPLEPVP